MNTTWFIKEMMSELLPDTPDALNEWGTDWQWRKGFKTSIIAIPDDLNRETIFASLDAALGQALEFEKKLANSL